MVLEGGNEEGRHLMNLVMMQEMMRRGMAGEGEVGVEVGLEVSHLLMMLERILMVTSGALGGHPTVLTPTN
jgi:hypothetical protein